MSATEVLETVETDETQLDATAEETAPVDTTEATEPVETTEPGEGEGTAADDASGGQQTEATEPKAPAFEDALLKRAESYGFTKEDAEAFGSPEALQSAMTAFDRRVSNEVRQSRQPAEQKPAEKPQEQPAQAQAQPAAQVEAFDLDKLMPAEKYDEDFRAPIKAVVDTFRGEIAQLRQQNQALTGWIQQQQQQAVLNQFDTAIQSLGHKDLYGEGSVQQLDPNSPQYKAVQQVWEQANILADAYAAKGITIPSVEEMVRRAERIVHGDTLTKKARESAVAEVTQKVQKRNGQSLLPPTQRRASAPDPEAEQKKEFSAAFKKWRGQ